MEQNIIMNKEIKEHLEVIQAIDEKLLGALNDVVNLSVDSLCAGGKLIFCGNGGSAADAQHLAAEFVVRFRENRPALAAISLCTDTSALTACGNDFSFEEVYARQVEALGNKGDILYAISTSGNSPNVVRAAEEAKKQGVQIVSITGIKDCRLDELADVQLKMPSPVTARIQEAYMLLGHILCGDIEDKMFSK